MRSALYSVLLILSFPLILFAQDPLNFSFQSQYYNLWNSSAQSSDINIQGNYAFIAADLEGLKVIDISNPDELMEIGEYHLEEKLKPIKVVDEHVFMGNTSLDPGFYIFSVSDPSNPSLLSFTSTPGPVLGIDVSENYLFAAVSHEQLIVYDITDPENPVYVFQFEAYNRSAIDVIVIDYLLFLLQDNGCIQTIYIGNLPSSLLVQTYTDLTNNYSQDFELHNSILYVCTDGHGLIAVDVSNPAEFRTLGSCHVDSEILQCTIHENYAYLLTGPNGLVIVDISDPENMFLVEGLLTNGEMASLEYFDNKLLIHEIGIGLSVIDVSSNYDPVRQSTLLNSGNFIDVAASNNRAFLACEKTGIRTVDVSDLPNPQETDIYRNYFNIQQVEVYENRVYISDLKNTIQILDISDPDSPIETGLIENIGEIKDFTVQDDLLFMAARIDTSSNQQAVFIFDVSVPESIELISTTIDQIDGLGRFEVIEVDGNDAYICDRFNRIIHIDISDTVNPEVHVTSYADLYCRNLDLQDDRLIISGHMHGNSEDNRINILDVSNPDTPELMSEITLPLMAIDLEAEDDIMIVAYYYGLQLYDISDESHPLLRDAILNMPLENTLISSIEFRDNILYCTTNTSLFIYEIENMSFIERETNFYPDEYKITSVYPNPFNNVLSLKINLPVSSLLDVSVYNILGEKVGELSSGYHNSGKVDLIFDASGLSSGTYFIKAQVPGKMNELKKIVLLK